MAKYGTFNVHHLHPLTKLRSTGSITAVMYILWNFSLELACVRVIILICCS